MALTRETKAELLASYQGDMASAQHAFLVGFTGITVGQVDDLRRRVRTAGGRYSVVKNRIARLAFEDSSLGVLSDHLVGPTAIAYSDDDPVGLAKTLTEFAEDVPVLEFKAGLVTASRCRGGDQGDRQSAQPGGAGGEAPVPAPVADRAAGTGARRHHAAAPPRIEPGRKSAGSKSGEWGLIPALSRRLETRRRAGAGEP